MAKKTTKRAVPLTPAKAKLPKKSKPAKTIEKDPDLVERGHQVLLRGTNGLRFDLCRVCRSPRPASGFSWECAGA